jgi:hypothetical protein
MKAGKSLAAFCAAAAASLVVAASASADTVVVHDGGDSSVSTTCTLRHAMDSLASGATGGCVVTPASGDDVITFDPSITDIQLEDSELVWYGADPLSIEGPGIASLSIAAASGNRVFLVQSGTSLTVSGMTILDGAPTTAASVRGGCVLNQGTLTLSAVRLTDCTSNAASNSTNAYADGAAIGNEGTLTINGSRVDNNHTTATNTKTGSGGTEAQARGAIYSEGAGGVTLNNTTVEENDATATDANDGSSDAAAYGGLAVVGGGNVNVSRSTFELNFATATEALGLAVTAGAIYSASPGSIELTTVGRNRGDSTGVSIASTGGIFDDSTGLAIRSGTIASNGPTTGTANGANVLENSGPSTFSNTIIANPRGGSGDNCAGNLATSAGFNVDYSPTGPSCFDTPEPPTDLTSDPLLSSELVNNGGPTETFALQPTSPVIDAGLNAGITLSSATQDQRGMTRPVDFSGIANAPGGNGTDIGAFEFQSTCTGQAVPDGTCPSGGGGGNPQPPTPGPTGLRAKALKKCKKIKAKNKAKAQKRKKCIKRAKKLPV